MIPILLYTHSEYSFLWKAAIPLLEKYANGCPIYFCCDSVLNFPIPASFHIHIYDATKPWSNRIKGCLETIGSEYLLYIQEDWLLIDTIDSEKLHYCLTFMKEHQCEFLMSDVRNILAPPIQSKYTDTVFLRTQAHYMQPALWKKDLLYRLSLQVIPLHLYETDIAYEITNKSICYGIVNTKFWNSTTRCLFYPHMHAINKGKWTFLKYPTLKALVEAYGIDTSTRGIDTTWLVDYQ